MSWISAVESGLGLGRKIAERFGISRQAAGVHLRRMVAEGLLVPQGETQARLYALASVAKETLRFEIGSSIEEDVLWTQMSPKIGPIPENARDIAFYGFTEMVNNVLDHSAGKHASIQLLRTPKSVVIYILDDGVGIFRKIATECHLEDLRHAILELSKGKLTTDRERHTGEGIFFTSRASDAFVLTSDGLALVCVNGKDWLLENAERPAGGTFVEITIRLDTKRTMDQVFRKFAVDEQPTFSRTTVPVSLAAIGDENLISRSQGKRLLARVEKFQEVMLDFRGVKEIGQAFADQVFRVFARQHPEVKLIAVRANARVQRMIDRALMNQEPSPPEGDAG